MSFDSIEVNLVWAQLNLDRVYCYGLYSWLPPSIALRIQTNPNISFSIPFQLFGG